jgi:hypothetical protein
VTLFKAALLGCVGVCSAQYLWRVLRGKPIPLNTIESLFQMRHNPLELANPQIMLSISFVLALFAWVVPFASIYPPGALTIASSPFLLTGTILMALPEVSFSPDYNMLKPMDVSRLSSFESISYQFGEGRMQPKLPDTYDVKVEINPTSPLPFLLQFSRSVISAGEIVHTPPPPLGANSTYILAFGGPQLLCSEVERSNRSLTLPAKERTHSTVNTEIEDEWDTSKIADLTDMQLGNPNGTSSSRFIDTGSTWPISQHKIVASMGCRAKLSSGNIASGSDVSGTFLVETTRRTCTELYVQYTANITYTNGVRSITYTQRAMDPQPAKDVTLTLAWNASRKAREAYIPKNKALYEYEDSAFASSPAHDSYRTRLQERLRYWNAFAIYAAFLEVITSSTRRSCGVGRFGVCDAQWLSPNGTRVPTGPAFCQQAERSKLHSIACVDGAELITAQRTWCSRTRA